MAGRKSLGGPELAMHISIDIFYFGCSFYLSESGERGCGLAQALLYWPEASLKMLALEEVSVPKSSVLH